MLVVASQQCYGGRAEKGGTTRVLFRSASIGAAFVAALFGLTSAPAVVQAPPPPPPPTIIDHYVGANPANAETAQVVGEPQPPTAIFVLRATKRVEAGQAITVEIVRQTRDGKTHDFRLKFEPENLVTNAPTEAVIEEASENWKADVATVDSPQAEGAQTLHIYLLPGLTNTQIGDPRTVDVVITRPPTFAVRGPAGTVERGAPVEFAIVRSGGSGQQRVNYNVTQGDHLVSTGELIFDEGGPPLGVGFTNYIECGEPVSFQLLGVKGETKATAAFPLELPDWCKTYPPPPPPWEDIVRKYWPFALPVPVGWLVWRVFRRRRKLNGTPEPQPLPPGGFGSRFTITAGRHAFPNGEPRLLLPDIDKRFKVVIGESDFPRPLPIREKVDD